MFCIVVSERRGRIVNVIVHHITVFEQCLVWVFDGLQKSASIVRPKLPVRIISCFAKQRITFLLELSKYRGIIFCIIIVFLKIRLISIVPVKVLPFVDGVVRFLQPRDVISLQNIVVKEILIDFGLFLWTAPRKGEQCGSKTASAHIIFFIYLPQNLWLMAKFAAYYESIR